jgi:hypothetical protein
VKQKIKKHRRCFGVRMRTKKGLSDIVVMIWMIIAVLSLITITYVFAIKYFDSSNQQKYEYKYECSEWQANSSNVFGGVMHRSTLENFIGYISELKTVNITIEDVNYNDYGVQIKVHSLTLNETQLVNYTKEDCIKENYIRVLKDG